MLACVMSTLVERLAGLHFVTIKCIGKHSSLFHEDREDVELCVGLEIQLCNEKNLVVWGIIIGDDILPSYIAIIINHERDSH